MTIRVLKSLPEKGEPWRPRPKCEETVVVAGPHEAEWRRRRYGEREPYRCSRDAVVEIGGRRLCGLHGGRLALEMALDGRLIPPSGGR